MLVVDDDPLVLAVVAELLEARLGAKVLRAPSADEGLEILRKERVDAVVSDFRMPEMEGTEFLALCAKVAPDTARVLMTGYGDVALVKTALNDARVNKMLLKPVDADELANAVSDAISRVTADSHRQRAFERASSLLDRDEPGRL